MTPRTAHVAYRRLVDRASYEEIASEMSVTPERVRQYEVQAGRWLAEQFSEALAS